MIGQQRTCSRCGHKRSTPGSKYVAGKWRCKRCVDSSRKQPLDVRRVDDPSQQISGTEVSAVSGSDDERPYVGAGGRL